VGLGGKIHRIAGWVPYRSRPFPLSDEFSTVKAVRRH
jgi:hypothetical protein